MIYLILFVIWTGFLILITKKFKELKKLLSNLIPRTLIMTNPAIGYDTKQFSLPNELKNTPYLLAFALPHCPHCEPQLEYLIDLSNRHGAIPILLVLIEDHKDVDLLKEKYNSIFHTVYLPSEKVKKLIDGFPRFMLVNEHSIIIDNPIDAKLAYNGYRHYLNTMESNISYKYLNEEGEDIVG